MRAFTAQIEMTSAQQALARAPDAYFTWTASEQQAYVDLCGSYKRPEKIAEVLRGLDMVLKPSFFVPKADTVDPRIQNSVHQVLGGAPSEKLQARNRSAEGKGGAVVLFSGLPEFVPPPTLGVERGYLPTREEAAVAMKDKFFMYGGAQHALGRLQHAYPRAGMKGLVPPTAVELRAALRGSGVYVSEYGYPSSYLRKFPFVAPEAGGVAVAINHNSDNGFPVLGKWTTPGAPAMVLQLVSSIYAELSKAPDVVQRVRELENESPHLFTLMGKAKADYYSQEKIEKLRLRFYNVVPRQLMLIIQTVTQPFDALCRKLGEDGDVRTCMGSSLIRQGGAQLVRALERQLDAEGAVQVGYLHVGDDSWVVVRLMEARMMFMCDLDCSNFDLTQHGNVTKPVHDALRSELRRFDKVAADLWYALMRERQVAVAATVVAQFKHGGPSGMPLQSKVNDVLMEILLSRFAARLKGVNVTNMWGHEFRPDASPMGRVIKGKPLPSHPADFMALMKQYAVEEASKMGFTVKVENLSFEIFPRRPEHIAARTPSVPPPLEGLGDLDVLPPMVAREIIRRAAQPDETTYWKFGPQGKVLVTVSEKPSATLAAMQETSASLRRLVRQSVPVVEKPTVKNYIRRRPFKFIGYYFQVVENKVVVYCDLPRTLAQMPYPSLKWVVNGPAFAAVEAMRVGSIFCSMGYPGPAMRATHERLRSYVKELIKTAMQRFGNQVDPRLRWATAENPFGGPSASSLQGLLEAVDKTDELWGAERELELFNESTLLPLDADASALWADQVEAEERREAGGRVVEPEGDILRPPPARRLKSRPVPTHPATEANAGRHPPTAVWGPDKAPRDRSAAGPSNPQPKGKGRRAGVERGDASDYDSDYEYEEYEYDDEDIAFEQYDDDDAVDFGGYSRRRRNY